MKRYPPCSFTLCRSWGRNKYIRRWADEACVRETVALPSHMILGPWEEYQIRLPRCLSESHNEYSDFGTIDPK